MRFPEVVYVRWMWCQSCRCIRPLRLQRATPQCRVCQAPPLELVK